MAKPKTQPHPLAHAAKNIVSDLLSTLLFVATYAIWHSIPLAVGVGVAFGLAQIAALKLRRAPIDLMQWMSLALVIVFGGAALLTHDPAFIKIKPTLIYLAIGFVMLRPGWMDRYLPPQAHAHSADINRRFGHIWASLCFATAGANMAFALLASFTAWAWFIFVFPTASKIVLVLVQYAVTRRIIRRRLRDPAAPVLAAP